MLLVADPELHPSGRRCGLAPVRAESARVAHHAIAVDAHAAEHPAVEVQQQACLDGALAEHLHVDLDLVRVVAGDEAERRRAGGAIAPCAQHEPVVDAQPVGLAGRRRVEGPPLPEPERVGVLGEALRGTLGRGIRRRRLRRTDVVGDRDGPTVVGPVNRLEQHLPAERAEPALVPVREHPPLVGRTAQDRRVPARPPSLRSVLRAGDRIAGMVLPRSVHRARAGDDDHVPGRRSRRAAHGADEVEPVAASEQLRALERVGLGDPLVGVAPSVVHLLELADRRQAVVGEPHHPDAVDEEVAVAVLADDVPRVDRAADSEVDRLRPRPAHRRRVDHEDRRLRQLRPRRRDERDVDEEPPVVLGDVDRERVAERLRQRRTLVRPVHEVGRAEQRQARRGLERRVRHPVLVADADHGRVGAVARENGFDERHAGRGHVAAPTFRLPATGIDAVLRRAWAIHVDTTDDSANRSAMRRYPEWLG